jgi:2-keto-4-pentenoate hydratase
MIWNINQVRQVYQVYQVLQVYQVYQVSQFYQVYQVCQVRRFEGWKVRKTVRKQPLPLSQTPVWERKS